MSLDKESVIARRSTPAAPQGDDDDYDYYDDDDDDGQMVESKRGIQRVISDCVSKAFWNRWSK